MKKLLTLIVCVIAAYTTHAQYCEGGYDESAPVIRRDTTDITYTAWSTGDPATSTYVWAFDDGTIQYGQTIIHHFTENPYTFYGAHAIVTVSDSFGCSTSFDLYEWSVPVFNCSFFTAPDWPTWDMYVSQPNIHDPGSVVMDFFAYGTYGWTYYTHAQTDWGDGRTTSQNFIPDEPTTIGGYGASGTDSSLSSLYQYEGQYLVHTSVYYYLDTITCPSVDLAPIALSVMGPHQAPVISGATT